MGVSGSKLSKIIGVGGVKRLRGPPLTPKGYIPVAVGVDNETKRFMVHTTAFCDADFRGFLFKTAEEYGFCQEGILRIPYESKAFEEYWKNKGAKQKVLRVRDRFT
ncbi:auxin-responsive protein SAUR40-like [Cornus florida]|uniref:auxin-responsive protein SAUR40-like n=1 Tax=Cornus florida TaxID=4283 RepID=UPI00289939F8|nr:auxin-responsive protein SAUR40-like [Cornus florida]